MKKRYQVTLYCTTGQYKPISTIVTIEQIDESNLLLDKDSKKDIINKGVIAICAKRCWSSRDVMKYNYTKVKAREYVKCGSLAWWKH